MKIRQVLIAAASLVVALVAALPAVHATTLLWGNNAGSNIVVEAFDPTTGAVVHQYALGAGNGRGVVVVGNTGYFTQTGSGVIGEFNVSTGALLGTSITTTASGFSSITYDGTGFWIGDYTGSNHAYHVLMNGTIDKTITLSDCTSNCDGLNYYIDPVSGLGRLISNRSDAANPGIYDVYDTNGNLITASLINNGAVASTGIAFNSSNNDFYVSNIYNSSVSVYTDTGSFVNTVTLGTPLPATGGGRYIEGMSFDYQQTLNLPPASVPEPASLVLFGVGLFGIGLARGKRA